MFQRTSICPPYRVAAQTLSAAMALFLLLGLTIASTAQTQAPTRTVKVEKARKLVHRVEPAYPQDLKRLGIGGVVKLDVQISAKGSVERVEVVGGNPILADSASRAVKQWQYEPADGSSSMLLNVEFHPNR